MPQNRRKIKAHAAKRRACIAHVLRRVPRARPAGTLSSSKIRVGRARDCVASIATGCALALTIGLVALPVMATIVQRLKAPEPVTTVGLFSPSGTGPGTGAGMTASMAVQSFDLTVPKLSAPPSPAEILPAIDVAMINPQKPAVPSTLKETTPTLTPGTVIGFVPPLIPDHVEMRRSYFREKVKFNPGITDDCTPAALLEVIYDIAEMYGTVRIHSTFRDPQRNRRVGGVQSSLHLECRAIDFSVPGHPRALVDFLRSRPEIGGFSRYPFGHFHIDNGPRRQW